MRGGVRAVPLALGLLLAGCGLGEAESHLDAATAAVARHETANALREYEAALNAVGSRKGPDAARLKARALKGAADIYNFERREARLAADIYLELIRQFPETREAEEARMAVAALLRNDLGDIRGAIHQLEGAVPREPEPKRTELTYRIAELNCEIGQVAACESWAAKAARGPGSGVFRERAYYLWAQAEGELPGGRFAARKILQELLAVAPKSELGPYAHAELGRLAAASGDYERAIGEWVTALNGHPDPASVQAAIARARAALAASKSMKLGDVMSAFDLRPLSPPKRIPVEE